MENKKSIWISIVVILLILVVLSFINMNYYKESEELIIDNTYELKDIIIKSNVANVYIKKTDEQIIKVKIYGDKNRTSVEDYDKLVIKTNMKSCKFFCFKNKIALVEVSLPKDYDYNLNIDNDYGDLNIETFEKGTFDINVDAGNVVIKEVSNLLLDVDAADVKIGKINKKFDIDVDAGNVIIDEINIEEDSSIEIDAGNLEINKTNEIFIDTKVDLGEVKIKNNYKDSNIKLFIKLDLGSVKIDN